ncbi:RNA polymerase sigma-70 factor (sigma-E family) [Herbihabitans rhizosphaerae]|uniref:RNA polymerase sigma-70 factor (Sigma-E family) n=1 Tax=Herbihabitans rhizosphaerae TaxID=1872711 RepID=A0A4Q7KXL5_9PSEU|nr:SigE family RNA polymerase sigma factor [Herbihabitans rhizosphaerae]RZS41396.1 RNA polymerase sigma-70 factor (sigma-E family) [Herbihabitans rhizosphaerae]
MGSADDAAFRDFASSQAIPLRRNAFLLCGDWHLADDLMQRTLIKVYRSWSRIDEREHLGSYARTVLLRTWLDERRRPWRRRERSERDVPDTADPGPDPDALAGRRAEHQRVYRALREVPPRQRAVLVLRYLEELSVAETAEAMRCSEGTVKSQTARGLAAMRQHLAGDDVMWPAEPEGMSR